MLDSHFSSPRIIDSGFHVHFPKKPPKMRLAPTHARHNSCQRPPKLFSPIVTFKNAPRPTMYEDPTATACAMGSDAGTPQSQQLRAPSRRSQVLQISTFRRFDFSTFPRAAPTHARHKCWHTFHERCVTLCHLRIEALRSVCTAPETAILPVLRKFDETCPPHRRSYGEV